MLENVLRANNRNDGAGRVRSGEQALLVRSEGRTRRDFVSAMSALEAAGKPGARPTCADGLYAGQHRQ